MFNVTGFTRIFPKQTHTFARARIFESRSCPKSVGNGKKCVIGRYREAHRAARSLAMRIEQAAFGGVSHGSLVRKLVQRAHRVAHGTAELHEHRALSKTPPCFKRLHADGEKLSSLIHGERAFRIASVY